MLQSNLRFVFFWLVDKPRPPLDAFFAEENARCPYGTTNRSKMSALRNVQSRFSKKLRRRRPLFFALSCARKSIVFENVKGCYRRRPSF